MFDKQAVMFNPKTTNQSRAPQLLLLVLVAAMLLIVVGVSTIPDSSYRCNNE